jgi:Fur family peroxide stress response transcriptional regulator
MKNKPERQLSLSEAREMLYEPFLKAGIKLTHQRIEIFREVFCTREHPSAETIHANLKKKMPSLSLDTVYRNLATFEELGLINRVSAIDRQSRFDANTEAHHHFICTRCANITDFYWEEFDKATLPDEVRGKGSIISKHVEIRGICRACERKTS